MSMFKVSSLFMLGLLSSCMVSRKGDHDGHRDRTDRPKENVSFSRSEDWWPSDFDNH